MPGCQLSQQGDVALWLSDGTPVRIEQGPRWLVQLAYCPPPWVFDALVAIAVVVIGLAALGWYRHGGLDEDVLNEMAELTMVGLVVIAATTSLVRLDVLPYVGDVFVGTLIGWGGVQVVVRGVQRVTREPS